MNLHIAAQYMKIGYRIRRPHWEPEEYLYELADMLDKVEVTEYYTTDEKSGELVKKRSISCGSPAHIDLQDLLAYDWEIIVSGIRKQFNKHGNFEYNDEPDWDNWKYDGDYFE